MKTQFLLAVFGILSSSLLQPILAQVSITAQAIAGGSDNDYLNKICKSDKGSVLLAGYSASNHSTFKTEDSRGSYDYWVVKLSGRRIKQWDKTIGGNAADVLVTAVSTRDSGYILGGYSSSGISGEKTGANKGGTDYWLVKIDSKGNIQWDKTIGSTADDVLYDLDQTSDGKYILTGSMGLMKTDNHGNVLWKKTAPNGYYASVRETTDGGYILTEFVGLDHAITKTDSKGNVIWSKDLGYRGLPGAYSYSTKQTKDGGFISYGYGADSYDEADEYYYDYFIDISKTDVNGNVQWHPNPFDNPLYSATPAAILGNCSMQETDDNGFIFGISTASSKAGSARDFYLLRFNNSGDLQWSQSIGGDDYDVLTDIKKLAANQYVLGGYSATGISGDKTKKNLGLADYWAVYVTDPAAQIIAASIATDLKANETRELFVYPNPAKNILHVETTRKTTFTLTDQSGKILVTKTITNKGEINVANLAPGLYYLKNNVTGIVQKVIVSR
jgi:hypothetical protein